MAWDRATQGLRDKVPKLKPDPTRSPVQFGAQRMCWQRDQQVSASKAPLRSPDFDQP